MDIQVQYALEVMEGLAATVEQGVYRLISYTPLNPLALDATAQRLLEQAAGTSLDVMKNDLGETIGYCAKGLAQGGNGASTEVSTQVSVLTKEVTVDAEMAAQEWKDIATGETATLTIGQTVTTVFASAAQGVAGILALPVTAAGAACGIALGVASGVLLYNAAPDFWNGIADTLLDAGELIGGKVKAIVNSNKKTSFSEKTIEIFKNAFLEAGFFDKDLVQDDAFSDPTHPNVAYQMTGQNAKPKAAYDFLVKEFTSNHPTMEINPTAEAVTKLVESSIVARWSQAKIPPGDSSGSGNLISLSNNPLPTTINFRWNEALGEYQTPQAYPFNSKLVYNYNTSTNKMDISYVDQSNTEYIVPDCFVFEGNGNVFASNVGMFEEGSGKTQEGATLPDEEPFTDTYPSWQPTDNIQGEDYYPVSMPTNDGTQAPSQTGDNDKDEQEDIIGSLLFNPDPIPDPTPQPDPDPQPQPEPQPEPTTPTPVTDPTDPNPDPEPSDPSPTLPIISGIHATKMCTIYNPTDGEVDDLGAFLWVDNVIEQIRLIFQDPMDGIISLHKIYAQPVTGTRKDIILGYIDSGVDALEVTNQFTTVNCGSVSIAETRNNATDYPPYTQAHIYLPFIGIEEIDVAEIMGGTVRVQYRVDAYTGTCVAQIFVTRSADMATEQMLYTFSGNASQTIPLTSANFTGLVSSLVSIAGGAATAGAGGALLAAARGMTTHMASVSHSGSISANAGIMGPRKPYIILTRQHAYDANGYNSLYGYPANTTRYLSNCTGYVRVKDVLYKGDGTEAEKAEIVSLLKNGVIV